MSAASTENASTPIFRETIECFINGDHETVAGADAFETLSDYLRRRRGLTGTKIVCAEGDCGACSVMVGRCTNQSDSLNYMAVDSCIVFMHQLDGAHIVTVEGLGTPNDLSAVQQAMVDCHGSQCGFCTPGFVTTIQGLLEQCKQAALESTGASCVLDESDWRLGLSGNLCRCTGYVQIMEAAQSITLEDVQSLNERYPPEAMIAHWNSMPSTMVRIEAGDRTVFRPSCVEHAVEAKRTSTRVRAVSGATDVGVQHNHGLLIGDVRLDLSGVDELRRVETEPDAILIGAATTWSDVLHGIESPFPDFADVIRRFGSPQIRNMGTFGGNLANASPIADSIPFLHAIDAVIRCVGPDGIRDVPVANFYVGYKQTVLSDEELIHSIRLPLPTAGQHVKLYKISKRRDMDISTLAAAFSITLRDRQIVSASIALGGVGPTVVRVASAERYLLDRELSPQVMLEAGRIARDEITPISDVRGSAHYRRQLTENLFMKCAYELESGMDDLPKGVAV
ncbi:MAG: FAD binding domain-containing protein [Planctomycetota bacterium]